MLMSRSVRKGGADLNNPCAVSWPAILIAEEGLRLVGDGTYCRYYKYSVLVLDSTSSEKWPGPG